MLGTGLRVKNTGMSRSHHPCLHRRGSLGLISSLIVNVKGRSSTKSAWLFERLVMSMEDAPLLLKIPQLSWATLGCPQLLGKEVHQPTLEVESIPAHSKQKKIFSQHSLPVLKIMGAMFKEIQVDRPALLLHSCVSWSKLLSLSVSQRGKVTHVSASSVKIEM